VTEKIENKRFNLRFDLQIILSSLRRLDEFIEKSRTQGKTNPV